MPLAHTFYIPVMGTGFTLDASLKLAHLGIPSVVSLVDDVLMEQIREHHCKILKEEFEPIKADEPDCRAKRITAYLNFLERQVKRKFEALRQSDFHPKSEIHKYFRLLPDEAPLKKLYLKMMSLTDAQEKKRLQEDLRKKMQPGRIDVNIMTKIDRAVATDEGGRPVYDKFSSALAALRGFAQSNLNSAVIFSAGVNKRLYSYVSEFADFYADSTGKVKKEIILKVNDFRSALTQGKIFAKKGLWVSAFRVESGLNCGGHAFGGQGKLLGPVLEEFRSKGNELLDNLKNLYLQARHKSGAEVLRVEPRFRVEVQGGIGTAAEDKFLRDYYGVDKTGWATPFLLCPEATNLDEKTLRLLAEAKQEDVLLSQTSPLGVLYYTLRNGSAETAKRLRKKQGVNGVDCVKGYLRLNWEFKKPLCPASKVYQKLKIEAIKASGLDPLTHPEVRMLAEKDCICHQLGNGVMQKYNLEIKGSSGVAVCPGPNIAYYSKIVSLEQMIDHIYGRNNIMTSKDRPHMFIKELMISIDLLQTSIVRSIEEDKADREAKAFQSCYENLFQGLSYYFGLLASKEWVPEGGRSEIEKQFKQLETRLLDLKQKFKLVFDPKPQTSGAV